MSLQNSMQILQLMEEISEPMNKIFVMEKLSGKHILINDDRSNMTTAVRYVNSIIQRHFSQGLEDLVNIINQTVRKELNYQIEKCSENILIVNKAQLSLKFCNKEIEKFQSMSVKQLTDFQNRMPEFVKMVKDKVLFIQANRNKLLTMLDEIIAELKQQDFIVEPDKIYIEFRTQKVVGCEECDIYYSSQYRYTIPFNYLEEFINIDSIKENLLIKVLDNFKRKVIKGESEDLQQKVSQICKSHGFKNTKFMDFRENTEKPYDFGQGYLNKRFKITKQNIDQFKNDIVNSITTINYIKEHGLFIGMRSIIVGTGYYCKFLKAEKVGEDSYYIYDIRNGDKALIEIFKNHEMLSGYQRKKMLKYFKYR